MSSSNNQVYLGFDCGTQSLKVSAIDQNCQLLYESHVHFDTDLKRFGSVNGVIRSNDDSTVVSASPLMWIAALDLCLQRLRDNCQSIFQLQDVVAISGSGQQHGSVYWRHGAHEKLSNLDSTLSLEKQLRNCFSRALSPIWMDNSTTEQCQALEQQLGGAQALASLTGSRAYERFTASQITKFHQTEPTAYAQTERISLVSSFMASLFLGQYAPIDVSDGSGMNLLNIATKQWSAAALDATAPELAQRLGQPCLSRQVLGILSSYFVAAFGFSAHCKVVAWSGDNPCSLAGMLLKKEEIAISLGTSDTLFASIEKANPQAQIGHVFCNPTADSLFMALLCVKNGALVRNALKTELQLQSWTDFEELLENGEIGNKGFMGFYYDDIEILPFGVKGRFLFDANNKSIDAFPLQSVTVRALIESQILSLKLHAKKIGLEKTNSVLLTGGASKNKQIAQIIANVFGCNVFVDKNECSASLGAAYRALHAIKCNLNEKELKFEDVIQRSYPLTCIASVDLNAHQIYCELLPKFEQLVNTLLKQ